MFVCWIVVWAFKQNTTNWCCCRSLKFSYFLFWIHNRMILFLTVSSNTPMHLHRDISLFRVVCSGWEWNIVFCCRTSSWRWRWKAWSRSSRRNSSFWIKHCEYTCMKILLYFWIEYMFVYRGKVYRRTRCALNWRTFTLLSSNLGHWPFWH